jgi:hypothetical protein
MLKPRLLLHLEGAAVLIFSVMLFQRWPGHSLSFILLFLTPDFFMVGYLVNKSAGAAVYNLGHTYVSPLLLWGILWWAGAVAWLWLPVIWLAHIGFDRLMGYGLKYETAFKDTHLQKV